MSGDEGHSSRGPKYQRPVQRNRWQNDPSPGVCRQPAGEEAGGRDLRLDQDGWWRAQAALYRGSPQPDVGRPDGSRLQPGSDGQTGYKPGLRLANTPLPGVKRLPSLAPSAPPQAYSRQNNKRNRFLSHSLGLFQHPAKTTPVPPVDQPALQGDGPTPPPTPTPIPQADEPAPTPTSTPAPESTVPQAAPPATPEPPISSGGGGAGGSGSGSLGTNLAITLGALGALLALLLFLLAMRRRRRQVQEALGPRIQ
jgi:hypothetical protein